MFYLNIRGLSYGAETEKERSAECDRNNGKKPRKWRRPEYSSWQKVQETGTVRVERRKKIEDWQAFFALSIIIFLTFFFWAPMLRTAFTKTLVFSANDFSLVMFGIILFIFWFMATLYLGNKLFNVLLILSYTFERDKIVREWRFFGIKRTKTFPITLNRFEIRPIYSWTDQLFYDWDSGDELVFLNVCGEVQCRIRNLTEREAQWLASLWYDVAGIPLPNKIRVEPLVWQVPRSFVCKPGRIRAVYWNCQLKAWSMLMFWVFWGTIVWTSIWGIMENAIKTPVTTENYQAIVNGMAKLGISETEITLMFGIPIFFACIHLVFSAYWFLGRRCFRLDSHGVRYTFSVILPLRIVRIPLESVDSFEIESYYFRLGQTDGRALAIKRNDGKKTTLVFGFTSIDYLIHELEWLKWNGNKVLEELKLEN